MSYDLAVWEGDNPADDGEAGLIYEQLYRKYIDENYPTPPTPRVRAYVDALLERWVDLTEDEDGELSPWSDGPLIDNASGPFIYFGMVYSRSDEVSAEAARMAAERDLVCYDPQFERLRPDAEER